MDIVLVQVYLGYNNVAALTILAGKQDWEANNINERVKVRFSLWSKLWVWSTLDFYASGVFKWPAGWNLRAWGRRFAVHKSGDGGQDFGFSRFLLSRWPAIEAMLGQKLSVCEEVTFCYSKSISIPHKNYILLFGVVFVRSCKEVEKADEEETVYHVKCATINGGKFRDFVFLLSKRQPCKDGWDFALFQQTQSVFTGNSYGILLRQRPIRDSDPIRHRGNSSSWGEIHPEWS